MDSSGSNKVGPFLLRNKVIESMSGESCRSLCENFHILSLACESVLELILFIVNNGSKMAGA
jgi:hypothetical protein